MSLRVISRMSEPIFWESNVRTRSRCPSGKVTLRQGSAYRMPPHAGYSSAVRPSRVSNPYAEARCAGAKSFSAAIRFPQYTCCISFCSLIPSTYEVSRVERNHSFRSESKRTVRARAADEASPDAHVRDEVWIEEQD